MATKAAPAKKDDKASSKTTAKTTSSNQTERARLVDAAVELNDKVGLEPAIDVKGSVDEIKAAIKDGFEVLRASDKFSEGTMAILKDLGWDPEPQDDSGSDSNQADDPEPEPAARKAPAKALAKAGKADAKADDKKAAPQKKAAAEKAPATPKPAEERGPTLSGHMTEKLLAGGELTSILESTNDLAKKLGKNELSPSQIRAHAKWLCRKDDHELIEDKEKDTIKVRPIKK